MSCIVLTSCTTPAGDVVREVRPLPPVLAVVAARPAADAAAPAETVDMAAWQRFLQVPGSSDLRQVTVRGQALKPTHGKGQVFGLTEKAQAAAWLAASRRDPTLPLQWALADLDTGEMLDFSAGAARKFYGASVAKVFVAAALLDKQAGKLTPAQLPLLADMIVASDNHAWNELQRAVGDGDMPQGQRTVQAFMQRLGLGRSQGFSGWLATEHGNELTAVDLVNFLGLTYQNRYPGAQLLWRLMHATVDLEPKASRYLPTSMQLAGKTGGYDGKTTVAGKSVVVHVRHHLVAFPAHGHMYGLALMSDIGSEEPLALVAASLVGER